MRTLIVYYSRTGKTDLIAKEIARVLNGDIIKIEEVRQRKGFLGFITARYDAIKEKCSEIKITDFKKQTTLTNLEKTALDNYDLIFIGTPVWAGKPTPAINTFISTVDFRDKKVVVFGAMAMKSGEDVVKILTHRINSKGGVVVNSFVIKTGRVEEKILIEKAQEIGRQYKN